MAGLKQDLIDVAANIREVTLVTTGRRSGKPRRVRIWISTDGARVYVRSGGGMTRDWPQNLLAKAEGTLVADGKSIKVKSRRVTDEDEARATSHLAREKYGTYVKPSKPGEPLTKGEQAVFELTPAS